MSARCIAYLAFRLVQIEHALAAVNSGTTSLGIKGAFSPIPSSVTLASSYPSSLTTLFLPFILPLFTFFHLPIATNGIVIATEKKTASILIDDSMLEKVCTICPNIGLVYSGMGPDYRVLVAKARKTAQAYWKIYGEYPTTRVLTQEIATIMQEATQSG